MRKKGLEFHIAQGDYFGTLATVIDLVRQDAEELGWRRKHSKIVVRLREDLVYLQRNYEIRKRK